MQYLLIRWCEMLRIKKSEEFWPITFSNRLSYRLCTITMENHTFAVDESRPLPRSLLFKRSVGNRYMSQNQLHVRSYNKYFYLNRSLSFLSALPQLTSQSNVYFDFYTAKLTISYNQLIISLKIPRCFHERVKAQLSMCFFFFID